MSPGAGSLPAPAPRINPESAPFWGATASGKLLLRRCPNCDSVVWYPRTMCPQCWHIGTEWFEASGHGSIYSFTVVHKAEGAYRDVTPYVVAYVELAEGPRIMTNVVEVDPSSVRVGQPVEVVFHDTGSGSALPRFRPADPT